MFLSPQAVISARQGLLRGYLWPGISHKNARNSPLCIDREERAAMPYRLVYRDAGTFEAAISLAPYYTFADWQDILMHDKKSFLIRRCIKQFIDIQTILIRRIFHASLPTAKKEHFKKKNYGLISPSHAISPAKRTFWPQMPKNCQILTVVFIKFL